MILTHIVLMNLLTGATDGGAPVVALLRRARLTLRSVSGGV